MSGDAALILPISPTIGPPVFYRRYGSIGARLWTTPEADFGTTVTLNDHADVSVFSLILRAERNCCYFIF